MLPDGSGEDGGGSVDIPPAADVAIAVDVARDQPGMGDVGGPDACGSSAGCTPANPCRVGRRVCGAAGDTCEDTDITQTNRTTCGMDRVCSGGTCVACALGAACAVAGQPTSD